MPGMTPQSPAQDALTETSTAEAYAVQERVAIGTAGVVYRALESATGQQVLLKLLSGETSHPMDPAWVLERAPLLMRLEHPHIARLLAAYDDPEGCVLIYAYQAGWAGNAFPSQRLLTGSEEGRLVARQLGAAIEAGEHAGIPHGDLKPSNLIISDQGTAGLNLLVLDWGLSECRAEQPPETLQFMAPERLRGGPATAAGDLFSLGASLWYLLTGRQPVDGKTREALLGAWEQFEPGKLARLRPDLEPAFVEWVGWLLKPRPEDRPGWVSQAMEVLNRPTVRDVRRGPGPALEPPPRSRPAVSPASVDADAPTSRLVASTATTCLIAGGSRRSRFGPQGLLLALVLLGIGAALFAGYVWWSEGR